MGISGIGASGTRASLAKGDYDIYRINDANNKLKSAFITTVVKQMDEYEKLVGFLVQMD